MLRRHICILAGSPRKSLLCRGGPLRHCPFSVSTFVLSFTWSTGRPLFWTRAGTPLSQPLLQTSLLSFCASMARLVAPSRFLHRLFSRLRLCQPSWISVCECVKAGGGGCAGTQSACEICWLTTCVSQSSSFHVFLPWRWGGGGALAWGGERKVWERLQTRTGHVVLVWGPGFPLLLRYKHPADKYHR